MPSFHNSKAFSIELFFAEGDPKGTIRAKRKNLTSLAFRIPRSRFEDNSQKAKLKKIEGIKSAGIYFLFGKDSKTNKESVYIGQAAKRKTKEDFYLFQRVSEHLKRVEKRFFKEVFFFTIEGGGLGSTELDYLEHKFCEIASDNPRFELKNKNSPPEGHVRDSETANLDGLVEESKLLFQCLDFNIFKELDENFHNSQILTSNKPDIYSYTNARLKVSADLLVKNGTYTLLTGSEINYSPTGKTKAPSYIEKIREELLSNNEVIKNRSGIYVLQKDVSCKTPSEAIAIVLGYSYNGKIAWKNPEGNSLKELEEDSVKEPQVPLSTEITPKSVPSSSLTKFILKNKNKKTGVQTEATMLSDNFRYILEKGSNILFTEDEEKFLSSSQKARKDELLKNKKITKEKDGRYVLQTNLECKSPSYCGIFVLGSSVNGRKVWRTEDGRTFDEVFPKTSEALTNNDEKKVEG